MFTIESEVVIKTRRHGSISLSTFVFMVFVLDPHLTTHQSNIRVWLRKVSNQITPAYLIQWGNHAELPLKGLNVDANKGTNDGECRPHAQHPYWFYFSQLVWSTLIKGYNQWALEKLDGNGFELHKNSGRKSFLGWSMVSHGLPNNPTFLLSFSCMGTGGNFTTKNKGPDRKIQSTISRPAICPFPFLSFFTLSAQLPVRAHHPARV